MNNKSDEVYMTLLKAKQNIAEYASKKVKNENGNLTTMVLLKK